MERQHLGGESWMDPTTCLVVLQFFIGSVLRKYLIVCSVRFSLLRFGDFSSNIHANRYVRPTSYIAI